MASKEEDSSPSKINKEDAEEGKQLTPEQKVHALQNELDRMRQPPLIEGVVEKVLDRGKVVVKSSTGPRFLVNVAKSVKGSIRVGLHVALNQRTFAVVETLPIDESEGVDFYKSIARRCYKKAYEWMLEEIMGFESKSEAMQILREKVLQKLASMDSKV